MIKQSLYYYATKSLRRLFGVRLSFKQAYQQDYLQSPRWKLLSKWRKAYDGGRCTYNVGFWGRCTQTHTLQVHHASYDHRGERGITGMMAEFKDLRTLCNRHHDMTHGYKEN